MAAQHPEPPSSRVCISGLPAETSAGLVQRMHRVMRHLDKVEGTEDLPQNLDDVSYIFLSVSPSVSLSVCLSVCLSFLPFILWSIVFPLLWNRDFILSWIQIWRRYQSLKKEETKAAAAASVVPASKLLSLLDCINDPAKHVVKHHQDALKDERRDKAQKRLVAKNFRRGNELKQKEEK